MDVHWIIALKQLHTCYAWGKRHRQIETLIFEEGFQAFSMILESACYYLSKRFKACLECIGGQLRLGKLKSCQCEF